MSVDLLAKGLSLASTSPGGDTSSAGLTFIEIALVIFFAVFVITTIWVVVGRRDRFQPHAEIPLHDEPVMPIHDANPESRDH